MRESKSRALPLGYTPSGWFQSKGPERTLRPFRLEIYGVGDGTRTREYKLGKLGPYHLATPA